ncbi:S8 family serine peptidase [Lysobacter tyrosinilyticus]
MKQQALAAALGAALAFSASGSALAAQPDANRVWVKFKAGAAPKVEGTLRAAGGKMHHRFDKLGAFSVTMSPQAVNALRHNPNIEYIEQDAPRYPFGQVTPYGIGKVQAPQTVSTGADGTGIKVCIIDSGIHAGHEDFAGIAMSGYPTGWNNDQCGHGTHVAGTIAAANNGLGVIGVSPGKVSLYIVKVFGDSCAWTYSSDLIDAAQRCQAAGAKIISMSLGGGGSSTTEANAFAQLNTQGILSIAAAGNDGNTTMSYPASYPSVMSVAATDSNNAHASFSQSNSEVDIAAPGVGVLSAYPHKDASLDVGAASYMVAPLDGTAQGSATGMLVNGGLCTSAGSWSGKVVLCQRGSITFAEKVANATTGGAAAVIVYNNVSGGFSGTLNGRSTIPAISATQEDGQFLVNNRLGQIGGVSTVPQSNANGYAYLDGTSMATPHVSGVAALVWSANPTATNTAVRNALESTALDLGVAGRDNDYGHGLVQALAATTVITSGGGDPPTGLTLRNNGTAMARLQVGLSWSGGSSKVDIYRGSTKIKSAITNTQGATDAVRLRTSTLLTYRVCNAGSTSCSNTAQILY